jgi:sensor histidine kinase YesM
VNEESFEVKVENTGKLNERNPNDEGGFGLKSTMDRLSLLYDENAQFSIFNDIENKMVVCKIILPLNAN